MPLLSSVLLSAIPLVPGQIHTTSLVQEDPLRREQGRLLRPAGGQAACVVYHPVTGIAPILLGPPENPPHQAGVPGPADEPGNLPISGHFPRRKYLKKTLYSAGIPKIEIERDNAKIKIYLHCARPGVVIGKGGAEIERLRLELEKKLGKPVALNIVEVKTPDTDAQLVAENIAQQLEKRISFRRAMKNCMGRAMRMGARGIKVMCSGRLGGAEIARSECYHDGTIPLQTIRADIDYGFAEAATTYGRIGIKVWIYKGEVLSQTLRTTPRTLDTKNFKERPDRPRRRDGRGGFNRDRKPGYGNRPQGGYNNNRGPRPAAGGSAPKEGGKA